MVVLKYLSVCTAGNILPLCTPQDLLKEWKVKGPLVEEITQKGSELESRIMEITAAESQLQKGER